MEMSNIPNPVTNQGFHSNDDLPHQDLPQDQVAGNTEIPQKRRPGRPKGSTKKNVDGEVSIPLKIKRPVGRPRKDGFPAGSVSASRHRGPKQPRHSASSSAWPGIMSGVGYPEGIGYPAESSISQHVPIDPNLQLDDWTVLAHTKPNAFLTALLAALAAPNPVSNVGPTVEEAFKSHLGSLAPNSSQSLPIPSLYYVLKTFWLPSSPSYFSLTASASTARTPSEHRFLYWDPQPLVFNGIACPFCATPLFNRGRISTGPIKIYDIEKPFFIIGCEYVCTSSACTTPGMLEGRKFASTDSSIFRSLPVRLKDEFPAHLLYGDTDAGSGPNIWNWKALGVSRTLWNLVRGCLRAGMRKEMILQIVHSVQHGVPEDEESVATPVATARSAKRQQEEEEGEDGEDGDDVDVIGQDVMEVRSDSAVAGDKVAGPDSGAVPEQEIFLQRIMEHYASVGTGNNSVTEGGKRTGVQAEAGPSNANHGASTSTLIQAPNQTPTPTPSSAAAPPHYAKPYGDYAFAAYAFFPSTGTQAQPERPQIQNLKRPNPFSAELGTGEGESEGTATKRSPRHCCKCGSQDCKGKGGRSFCPNGCQDCGKLDCKGRNSRRPDKRCDEGWAGLT